MPEVLYFLNDVLKFALLCNTNANAKHRPIDESDFVRQIATEPFLRMKGKKKEAQVPSFNFKEVFSMKPTDPFFQTDIFRLV